MSDKYLHLADEAAALADADVETRVRAVQAGTWIPYPRAKEILARMEDLLNHPPIPRMPNLLLVAPSNNGKTQILKHFHDKHPSNPNPDGDAAITPVVRVQAPAGPDIGELCKRALIEVNAPYREKATPAERLDAVKKIFRSLGVRMFMIDEIQDMLAGGAVKQRAYRAVIKDLGNALMIPIVAAGVEEAYTVFSTDPQLSNRFDPEFLPLWEADMETGRFLSTLERRLPLREPSNLKAPELLQKIVFMSEGPIGEIHGVVKAAAIQAIRSGAERITLKLLDEIRWTKPSDRKKRPAFA